VKAGTTLLTVDGNHCLTNANDKITKLRRDKETKLAQRAKVKHVQEEANNTKYFHLVSNGNMEKKKIFQVDQDEGIIVGQDNLKTTISEYCKNIFAAPTQNNFSIIKMDIDDIPQLLEEENRIFNH
jgi:hypothetical protein